MRIVAREVSRATLPSEPSLSTTSSGRNGWRRLRRTEAMKISTVSRTAKPTASPTTPAAPSTAPMSAVAFRMSSATTSPATAKPIRARAR